MPISKRLKSSDNKKRQNQLVHAKRRASERYDLSEYNSKIEKELIDKIINSGDGSHSRFIRRDSNRISIWIVLHESKEFTVCYDSYRKRIVTFLPPGCEGTFETVTKDKEIIEDIIKDSPVSINKGMIINSLFESFGLAQASNQVFYNGSVSHTEASLDSSGTVALNSVQATFTAHSISNNGFEELNQRVFQKRIENIEDNAQKKLEKLRKTEEKKKRFEDDRDFAYQAFLGKSYEDYNKEKK